MDATAVAIPEQLSAAMLEIARTHKSGLLALAIGCWETLMDADVTQLAGAKVRHDPGRIAVRHGRKRRSMVRLQVGPSALAPLGAFSALIERRA